MANMSRLPTVGGDTNTWGTILNDFLSVSLNADGTLNNMFVDARDYGVAFDNVTDDTVALQAAIDACPLTDFLSLPNANDWPAKTLVLPAGRAKITGPLLLPANITIMGQGPSSTYIAQNAADNTFELATGNEVQTQIRNLGIIGVHAESYGIDLTQTGQTSILGDAAHQIDNVMMVGGRRMLFCFGNTECRFSNMLSYRQSPLLGDAAVYISGTDHMVERVTVAQPQYAGVGGNSGGAGLRAGTSNSRFLNVKIFGGDDGGQTQAAFYLIGQRNTVTALEIQDYSGGIGIEDDQGLNSYTNVVVDSCESGGIYAAGAVTMTNVLLVNRGGGSFTMPWALNIDNSLAAIVDTRISSVASVFSSGGQTGAGNFITVNGVSVP